MRISSKDRLKLMERYIQMEKEVGLYQEENCVELLEGQHYVVTGHGKYEGCIIQITSIDLEGNNIFGDRHFNYHVIENSIHYMAVKNRVDFAPLDSDFQRRLFPVERKWVMV